MVVDDLRQKCTSRWASWATCHRWFRAGLWTQSIMIFELMWVGSVPTRQLRAEHTELAYLRKIWFFVNSPGKITLSEVYGISQRYLSEDSCPHQGKMHPSAPFPGNLHPSTPFQRQRHPPNSTRLPPWHRFRTRPKSDTINRLRPYIFDYFHVQ